MARKLTIIIDDEFRGLIPPLTTAERDGLQTDLEQNGCRDSLKVWGVPGCDDRAILLDGHNRYEICQRLGIPFETDRITLDEGDDRTAAKIWIIQNQFNRRNLSPFARGELALVLEPLIAAKAKERQRQGGIEKVVQISAQPKTRDEVAKAAKVSHDTIAKVKVLAARAPEAIKEKLRRGETTINKECRAITKHDDGRAVAGRSPMIVLDEILANLKRHDVLVEEYHVLCGHDLEALKKLGRVMDQRNEELDARAVAYLKKLGCPEEYVGMFRPEQARERMVANG